VGKPTGFLEATRELPKRRPVEERVKDWNEVYLPFPEENLKKQAARCMDCGVPFCNQGCPLGNIIPDWNDLVYKNRWREAIDRLHLTNNFPEFTGKLCPAPCEGSCVLGINEPAVTIKQIEATIIDRAWEEGWVKPQPPTQKTGKKIAVVGSGPAGLAVAQQLARVGHDVTVYERDDKIGGLLRYGIPEFKMEKRHVDRRLKQMEAEGVKFVTNAHIGVNTKIEDIKKNNDAVVLCGGACAGRDLKVPGRELKGIHFAMEYLPQGNRAALGETVKNQILATGKHVVIIGGGDTGADCLGTAIRQGAKSIKQFELLPQPPKERAAGNPWPQWPLIWRTSSAHEENDCREWSIETLNFSGDASGVKKLNGIKLNWKDGKPERVAGSEFSIDAELVLLAMGFVGPEKPGMLDTLGVKYTERGNVWADENKMTSVPGVFVAGDMTRGQSLMTSVPRVMSLIVWAIAEGRNAAYGVDKYLMGETTLKKSF
jgi:glutamate synthase (NADPH) small chain